MDESDSILFSAFVLKFFHCNIDMKIEKNSVNAVLR